MLNLKITILNHIHDYFNVLLRNIALFVLLGIALFSILAFVISYICYKYHKRIYNKFAVYILNNSWISLLAQNMMLMIELDQPSPQYNEEDVQKILEVNSIGSKIRYIFGSILRNFTSYLDIVQCKNYFRFK